MKANYCAKYAGRVGFGGGRRKETVKPQNLRSNEIRPVFIKL